MKTKTLQLYTKDFGLKAAQGVEVTSEILAKINKYALRELTPEEIFVRRFLMAHNAVDRDNQRFPEPILDDFARTLPGKSLLNGHDRYTLPLGLYFDAFTEELTPEQFTALTGEEARLPEGVTMVKVLWGWVYMLKANFNESTTANIDAGIYRHASIGFKATDITPVKGPYDNVLYWEYVPPGEAFEGSIVWLGAQPGATAQKQHDGNIPGSHTSNHLDIDDTTTPKGGSKSMEKLLKILAKLFPGKAFTEDGLTDELKDALKDHAAKAAADEVEKAVNPLNEKITQLTSLAADGKAYRDGLITEYVTHKAKLGEVAETPEAQDTVKAVASAYPIAFLKSEVAILETRVNEKFPDKGQTRGDDRQDKSKDGGEKKDYSKDNPLSPNKKEDK